MPNLEMIVICLGALCVARVVYSIVKYSFVAVITKIHFDEKSFYEKYDRATVESMSERGGW